MLKCLILHQSTAEVLLCFSHVPAGNAEENADINIRKATRHSEATRMEGEKSEEETNGGISLPPFGLATYKLQGDLWIRPQTSDHGRMIHLYSAADSWLKQLSVFHHDFNFFTFHSTV